MSQYSIRDVEQLSGIKAHTLRVWELRYNFIKPKRTDTNIRCYNAEDLKMILNISLLKDKGYKISKLCNMAAEALQAEVRSIMDKKMGYSEKMQGLTLAMLDWDEDRFEKILGTNILHVGFERTMINLIFPFLGKMGILWQTGTITPAQEHFFYNLVRQKIIVAIDGIINNSDNFNKKYLLFLPENEYQEIGLLLSSYIIKSRNQKVVFIGQSVPLQDLIHINENLNPDFVLTVLTSTLIGNNFQKFAEDLSISFANSRILLSVNQIIDQNIILPHNVILISRFQDLIDFIEDKSK